MTQMTGKKGHARAAAYFSGAAAALNHVVTSTESGELELAYRAVETIATLRDGVLRHALATILSTNESEYRRFARMSAGAVIQKAAAAHPELLA